MPNSPDPLTRAELRRYSRPLLVPEWAEAGIHGDGAQERLKVASVLLVGAGGLGGPVALQLGGAGVGRLTIADSDTVALSNLHRQTQFGTPDLGRSKAGVLAARVQNLNPYVQVRTAPHLSAANAAELVAQADLVIDATDNFETRYLLADTCRALQKTCVWGAASGTSGMVSVFGPQTRSLRELFPDGNDTENCDELGVLGPVPGIIGGMMALEALKVLSGVGEPLLGRLWTFDALTGRVRVIRV